jgi:hypothetical protein
VGIVCESVIDADGIKDLETAREIIRQLQKAIEALQREVADLRRQLEESKRAGKRQAGPFSKGEPKAEPKTPGQKLGHAAAHRAIPDKYPERNVTYTHPRQATREFLDRHSPPTA